MQTALNKKIKVGQIWRNKEKNYTITVISKDKKDLWKVSAHGKGRTTHGMTEDSFHYYELVDENNNNDLSKEDLMTLTDEVRDLYNDKININEFFSVNDLVNLMIEHVNGSIDSLKIINAVNSFVHKSVSIGLITKHTDKKKNSTSKKIFQKIDNIDLKGKEKKEYDIKINEKHFIKTFNNIENGQKFDSVSFYNYIIDNIGCNDLEEDKKQIIRSRVYSFISKCVKKGYIEREGQRYSTLTKIKDIENGFVLKLPVEDIKVEEKHPDETVVKDIKVELPVEDIKVEEKHPDETVVEEPHVDLKNEKEIKEKLDILNKKFRNVELKDLVETATIYFNILIEKDLLHESVISKFNSEIIDLKQDQENLINKINDRNKTINSLTKIIKVLNKEILKFNKEILKFDKDLEFQLEENEKLKFKNTDLQNRIVQLEQKIKDSIPEETEAWQSIKYHEAINMN